MLESPKDYNEMLPKLNVATAVTTWLYAFVLVGSGLVPRVKMESAWIPPLENKELVNWVISFGIIPIAAALLAFFLSVTYELHNILAKWLGLRFLWDKHFIVRPLRLLACSDAKLDRYTVAHVMKFYYKSVKDIDQHYVQVFWKYALSFWILFEHLVIVGVSIPILLMTTTSPVGGMVVYWLLLLVVTTVQFLMVTSKKSTDQAEQIPLEKVEACFAELDSNG